MPADGNQRTGATPTSRGRARTRWAPAAPAGAAGATAARRPNCRSANSAAGRVSTRAATDSDGATASAAAAALGHRAVLELRNPQGCGARLSDSRAGHGLAAPASGGRDHPSGRPRAAGGGRPSGARASSPRPELHTERGSGILGGADATTRSHHPEPDRRGPWTWTAAAGAAGCGAGAPQGRRDPGAGGYQDRQAHGREAQVAPLAFPELRFAVADLVPPGGPERARTPEAESPLEREGRRWPHRER